VGLFHPKAVRFFERQWLVNLILWSNYARLRDAALMEIDCPPLAFSIQPTFLPSSDSRTLTRGSPRNPKRRPSIWHLSIGRRVYRKPYSD
jgi:hypothetical protein